MENCAELLTDAQNFAIIQLPGRKFPGVVVQGDTLSELVRVLESVKDGAQGDDRTQEVLETLSEALQWYKSVCRNKGINLPFMDDAG